MIHDELALLKEVFLDPSLDQDELEDNRIRIEEWERALRTNTALKQWQNHDITREIAAKARETYIEAAVRIVERRDLSDADRFTLWAKRDAAQWILSMTNQDPDAVLTQVEEEVRRALSHT